MPRLACGTGRTDSGGVERASGTSVRIADLEPEADGGSNLPRAARAREILMSTPDTTTKSPEQNEPHSYSEPRYEYSDADVMQNHKLHEVRTCPVCWHAQQG